MEHFGTIQGTRIGPAQVQEIRDTLRTHPDWCRSRLSVELCKRWNLTGPDGSVKDMACRNLLLKLHRRGAITLPAPLRGNPNAARNRHIELVQHCTDPVQGSLSLLEPVSVSIAARGTAEERLFNCLVAEYHYLGMRSTVGRNIKYVVRSGAGRVLACLLFGSAAWKTRGRDGFIGWDTSVRQRNLQCVTNNTRFLVLPWVRVRCLASRVLSLVARRINTDWLAKYGHQLYLLETFVDTARFRGTCYRAANWIRVGRTTGRTRNNRTHQAETTAKDVYVFPLCRSFRRELCR
jgi:hypothetical protein